MTVQHDKNGSSTLALALDDLAAQAAAAGLLYVSDNEPGIRRIRRGRGFHYIGPDKKILIDKGELERIARLAIPPAYTDVWICLHAQGHLQATGIDARKRKQYRYHPGWRVARDGIKFDRMVEFGEALPGLRQCLQRDLRRRGLPREKILAAIVSLLDTTRVRIGNLSYARDNRSFGLTTLRKRHLAAVSQRHARLKFRGKSGVEHEVDVDNPRIVKIIRDCQQLRGQHLFKYLDEAGKPHPIGSEHVNGYLREIMGAEFTAKDFRTWGATLRAFELMLDTPLPEPPTKRALRACIVTAIKKVAEELRNTVAVCRKSYINPLIFSAWQTGVLQQCMREESEGIRGELECMALAFLRRAQSE
ncbi:DNA topoisomerase IB [Nitrosospira sp. Nsp5]|uniref:DNA topoisomerase n=1 Tax=Nitrosospira multiformis TaxID=1231 RepID=A0ABY0THA0_9PROT|nr:MULTISPECIES: DNA topoisomerase IB [Nitrosospira]PTR05548.1 DNA topoisomerase IB [Nitrosospira sp. Nsp5]SDQ83215.1 DNA topoisomerase IB [Nitrosospira multiformis]